MSLKTTPSIQPCRLISNQSTLTLSSAHMYQFGMVLICIAIWGCAVVDDDLDPSLDSSQTIDPNAPLAPGDTTWGEIPEHNGLGYNINCYAPDRDAYITAQGGNPETMEGDLEALEHTILFVFDKSGSMDQNWKTDTKWNAAADAMTYSVDLYSHYVSAGAIFFPTVEDCHVDSINSEPQINFTSGDNFLLRWENSMSQLAPGGGTPLSQALEQADHAIYSACNNGILERPFKVVILTDGEPNCDGDMSALTAYPEKWLAHGIKTFVIGLPGHGSAENTLTEIAIAGGTATPSTQENTETDVDSDNNWDTETDADADSLVPTETDTGGVIDPDDEEELEDQIAICIE